MRSGAAVPLASPRPFHPPDEASEPAMEDVIRQYLISDKPYYRPVGPEIELYEAAYAVRMPMMLKGPTGCGKTRFVEFMSWKLGRPLITLACNEDMTGSDLVGR